MLLLPLALPPKEGAADYSGVRTAGTAARAPACASVASGLGEHTATRSPPVAHSPPGPCSNRKPVDNTASNDRSAMLPAAPFFARSGSCSALPAAIIVAIPSRLSTPMGLRQQRRHPIRPARGTWCASATASHRRNTDEAREQGRAPGQGSRPSCARRPPGPGLFLRRAHSVSLTAPSGFSSSRLSGRRRRPGSGDRAISSTALAGSPPGQLVVKSFSGIKFRAWQRRAGRFSWWSLWRDQSPRISNASQSRKI